MMSFLQTQVFLFVLGLLVFLVQDLHKRLGHVIRLLLGTIISLQVFHYGEKEKIFILGWLV